MATITVRKSQARAAEKKAKGLVGEECWVLWGREWGSGKIVDGGSVGEMMVFWVEIKGRFWWVAANRVVLKRKVEGVEGWETLEPLIVKKEQRGVGKGFWGWMWGGLFGV